MATSANTRKPASKAGRKAASPVGSVDTAGDIRTLAKSWDRSLRAQNRSPNTRAAYNESLRQLCDFLDANGMPTDVANITREHVETWLADLAERRSPATVNKRHIAASLFFKWCAEEGEVSESPMRNMTAPAIPVTPVPVADDDTLRKLLKACEGKDFADRRDTAIVRLLIDTGLRRGELAGMTLEDVDLERDLVHVIGKGRRPRAVPFGAKTGQAIDRYLRARAKNQHASLPALWLGIRGPVTGSGVAQILETRCAKAGIEKLHPHQLRHTMAHRWLADGQGETDLMALTGWRSRSMLSRYAASAAAERARDAHRRAALGDRL
jgi:site-specific recombinase XerD